MSSSSFESEQSTCDESSTNEEFELSETISRILFRIIKQSRRKYPKFLFKSLTKGIFASPYIPSISLENYIQRIQKFSKLEDPTLIIALIYIDRLISSGKIILSKYNIHKLVFISIYESIKYNEDEIFKLDYYSQISGISKNEINELENEFLNLIEFKLFVSENEFSEFHEYIMEKAKEMI